MSQVDNREDQGQQVTQAGPRAHTPGRPRPPCRGGPGYKVWHFGVPEGLDAEVKRLAAEQRRTVTQQVVWLVEQAIRRERDQQRRAVDGAEGRGAA